MSKIGFYPYSKKFAAIFNKEKDLISSALGKCEIHHIGSTAVPKMGGKGIVDIMIALDSWKEERDIVERLRSIGFHHVHPKEGGQIFLSRIPRTKHGDTHLHIVKKGTGIYKEYLAFRDYLRAHRAEAKRYADLKRLWRKQAKGVRTYYTTLKGNYVKDVLKKCHD
mgnify:CR=1 FL=1